MPLVVEIDDVVHVEGLRKYRERVSCEIERLL
jgi:hypothetical protein